jgi:hypothetical protein
MHAEPTGVPCIASRPHRCEITAKRSGVSAVNAKARLAALKLSQRRFAMSAGVAERSVRAALARPGDMPSWLVIALQHRELIEGLGRIVASYAQTGTHVSQRALTRLYDGMFPPKPRPKKEKVKARKRDRSNWAPRKKRQLNTSAELVRAALAARPLPPPQVAPKSDFDFEDTVNGIKTVSFAIRLR